MNQTARALAAEGKRHEKQTKERIWKKAKDRSCRCAACPDEYGSCARKIAKAVLLQLDLGPGGLELLLDLFRVSLGDVLLHGLWGAFNKIFRFFKA